MKKINKRGVLLFLGSTLAFAVLTIVGSHYLNNFACKGCPPQSWEEVWGDKWGILLFSSLFGGYVVFVNNKGKK